MRVEAVWAPEGGVGTDLREHPLLPPHRRARRPLRRLQGAPLMRDVAVVSFAQTKNVRRENRRNEVEMLIPVVRKPSRSRASRRRRSASTCSGSSDYLAGQSFSFVMAVDSFGAWPPIAESHVEMDGAWALYEAWIKIQCGEADSALACSLRPLVAGCRPRNADAATRSLHPRPPRRRPRLPGRAPGPRAARFVGPQRARDGRDRCAQPRRRQEQPVCTAHGRFRCRPVARRAVLRISIAKARLPTRSPMVQPRW